MKRLLRMTLKVALFIAILITCSLVIPWKPLTDLLTGNMSLDMAIKISETVLGETYPEPYEFIDSMITTALNFAVSIVIYLLVIKAFRHVKKPSCGINNSRNG